MATYHPTHPEGEVKHPGSPDIPILACSAEAMQKAKRLRLSPSAGRPCLRLP